ncbi:MAG TPA: hypothetical protein VFW06_07615 [Acidimicrobiia bacterium]|nr:hypothetical protein [Acidimicrobiia bacterium]
MTPCTRAPFEEVLGGHNDIIQRNLAAFDGTVIKSQGDGCMRTFPSERAALRCMTGDEGHSPW